MGMYALAIFRIHQMLNYAWTPTSQSSNTCKIRVTVAYSGGVASDVKSNANFSITNTSSSSIGFQLNSQLSHLYWPQAVLGIAQTDRVFMGVYIKSRRKEVVVIQVQERVMT